MGTLTIDSSFLYRTFSHIYYTQQLPEYDNNECSTTQSVQCLLKSFNERKFGRKLLDSKITLLTFGRIIHLALQDDLKKEGFDIEVEKQQDLPNGILWTHTDAIKDKASMEIKTISSMPTDILSHHYLQSNTYVNVNKLEIGYVPYIHKPSGIIKVFSHKPDQRQYIYVCSRATRLIHHLRTNVRPEPEPSWLCQYCEYTDICPAPKPLKRAKGGF
jgi:CRISPR/Cas system-associated exonuclease Cas4 (RecB family)